MTSYAEENAAYIAKFEQYPLTMAHPNYEASKSIPVPGTERRGPNGQILSQDYRGTPERLPPVTVHDLDQQEYYEAQGYQIVGKSDPAAYAKAHASPAPASHVPEEYPKWVNGVLCNDGAEAQAAESRRQAALHAEEVKAEDPQGEHPDMAEVMRQLRELAAQNAELKAAHAEQAHKNKGGRPRKVAADLTAPV